MKSLLFVLLVVGLSSCEFYYIEPRIDARDRVTGWHDVEEYSETFNDYLNYSIYIGNSGSYGNEIYIDNFYGADIRVYATVVGDKIDICRQVVDGYDVEGVGTVYSNEIRFNYRVKDTYSNVSTDYCEATAWRE